MCNFKSALLIPRFPTSDGFDLFHREGVDSHTELMELAKINPNDTKVNVAKLELIPNNAYDLSNVDTWEFILDELRRPDWLDDAMLSDAEYELRKICSRYITKDGECTVFNQSGTKYWYLNGKRHRTDGPAIESNARMAWYINGELHREDGPAIVWFAGAKEWYFNGERHRTDGPALESANGTKYWFFHGKRHREDGPACEYADGSKVWYLNDNLHREDGPAVEWGNGNEWYINGEPLTEEEFNQR